LFLLVYDRLHVVLYSFPTRRSSDLDETIIREMPRYLTLEKVHMKGTVSPRPLPYERNNGSHRPSVRPAEHLSRYSFTPVSSISRSEEHTSELQSRENLVCRLLLEKK